METFSTVISIVALTVSVLGFLHARSLHRRQIQLDIGLKFQEVRLELHDICLSLLKLANDLHIDKSGEYLGAVNSIVHSLSGLIETKELIRNWAVKAPALSWTPSYVKSELELQKIHGDVKELKKVTDEAWECHRQGKHDELSRVLKGIEARVHGEKPDKVG